MKIIDLADAKAPLAGFARIASKEPIVVMCRGKPLAAVIALDDADYESLSLSTNPRFLEILARSRARLEAEGGIPLAEMYRRLCLRPPSQRRAKKPRRNGRGGQTRRTSLP